MANAPYEVNVSGTDDETFAFSIPFENADGTDFPFADYAIEYSLVGQTLLTLGNGVAVTAPKVTFRMSQVLRKGTYQHGCRIRHLQTGDVTQIFDGTVSISEGNF